MGANAAKSGYQILEIMQDSPSSKVNFLPHLDFIMAINGSPLANSQIPFQDLIQEYENTQVSFEIFSLETMTTRNIDITPSQWCGEGLLGLNLRYENSSDILNRIMHITKVSENSPANFAGVMEGEYIVGYKEGKLKDLNDITEIVLKNKEIHLSVYNKHQRMVRNVKLECETENLGIEVACGDSHRIHESLVL